MADIGRLAVTISANPGPFAAGLNTAAQRAGMFRTQVQQHFGNVTSGAQNMAAGVGGPSLAMAGMLGGVAGAAASAAAAIGGRLVGAVVAAGRSMITAAAQLEGYEVSLGALAGGTENATRLLADLKAFALTTPFELPDLMTATQRMLAFGFGVEQVVPMLRRLGDVAAAMPEGMQVGLQRIIVALGQMQGKQRVMSQEMNQLTEAGVPAWEMLARVLNTDVRRAMAMVEAGQVTAAQGMRAVMSLADDPRFKGMMERQSRTFTGIMSNMRDMVWQMSAGIGQPLFNAVKEGVSDFVAFLQGPTAAAIGSAITGTMGAIMEAVRPVVRVLMAVATPVLAAWGAMVLMNAAATGLAAGLALVAVAVVVLAPIVIGMAFIWGRLVALFHVLRPVMDAVATVLSAIWDGVKAVAAEFSPLVAAVREALGVFGEFSSVGDAVRGAGVLVASVVRSAFGAVVPIVRRIVAAVIEVWATLAPVAGAVVRAVGQVITPIARAVGAIFGVEITDGAEGPLGTFKTIIEAVGRAFEWMGRAVGAVMDFLAPMFSDMLQAGAGLGTEIARLFGEVGAVMVQVLPPLAALAGMFLRFVVVPTVMAGVWVAFQMIALAVRTVLFFVQLAVGAFTFWLRVITSVVGALASLARALNFNRSGNMLGGLANRLDGLGARMQKLALPPTPDPREENLSLGTSPAIARAVELPKAMEMGSKEAVATINANLMVRQDPLVSLGQQQLAAVQQSNAFLGQIAGGLPAGPPVVNAAFVPPAVDVATPAPPIQPPAAVVSPSPPVVVANELSTGAARTPIVEDRETHRLLQRVVVALQQRSGSSVATVGIGFGGEA